MEKKDERRKDRGREGVRKLGKLKRIEELKDHDKEVRLGERAGSG